LGCKGSNASAYAWKKGIVVRLLWHPHWSYAAGRVTQSPALLRLADQTLKFDDPIQIVDQSPIAPRGI
jgi:hypothetical protein